jgi:hypothetical protein
VSKLPLERTDAPGIYRRGSKYVVVYRVEGSQRKQYADTLARARAIKLKRDGEARALRRGPTLHGFGLSWLDRYAGDEVRIRAAGRGVHIGRVGRVTQTSPRVGQRC